MRAYKRTVAKAGSGDGEAWVAKQEFRVLLTNLFYFTMLWDVFDDIDTGEDREIDLGEFIRALSRLRMNLTVRQAEEEFEKMDRNSGGNVWFDEFCRWVATTQA